MIHSQSHSDCLYRIILVVVILESDFFQRTFHVHLDSPPGQIDHNDPQLHTIVYLQVAIISQALIFVTRSHGFFFMERPSVALMAAFCLAQLVSSIIAGFANWGFTHIQKISGAWIGIIWVWVGISCQFLPGVLTYLGQDIIWFVPLDMIKFAMKATVIKYLRDRHNEATAAATRARAETGVPILRTQSRAASIHESLYSNRTSFIRRAARKVGFGQKIRVKAEELQRFSSIQAHHTGQTLARHPSRPTAA
jgi:H+-transporting ATPase